MNAGGPSRSLNSKIGEIYFRNQMGDKYVRVGGRGTSRRLASKEEDNWSGSAFANLQKQRQEQSKDKYVSTGRGTGKIKFGDLGVSSGRPTGKGMWVRTGRGTGRRKVE